ncbi:hypothetical protein [Massilia antarctica]|nr:hypothetical protein [Massilia antarctica]
MFYEIVTTPEAVPLFQRSRGCRSLRLERSVENPDTYKVVIA